MTTPSPGDSSAELRRSAGPRVQYQYDDGNHMPIPYTMVRYTYSPIIIHTAVHTAYSCTHEIQYSSTVQLYASVVCTVVHATPTVTTDHISGARLSACPNRRGEDRDLQYL